MNRKSNGLAARKQRFDTAKHQQKSSASVDTSIRVDRYEHLRRSIRASASVDADDRSREYEEEKRWGEKGKEEREAEEREVQAWGKRGASVGKEGCVGGVSKLPYSKKITKP